MNNETRLVPKLITAGVFDSSQIYPPATQQTANRRVSMFEIELPIGNSGISHIGSQSYAVAENTVLCAKPGQIRHTSLPYKCYYIHVIIEDEYYAGILKELPDIINIQNREIYVKYFDELIAATTNPCRENDILIECKMLEMIYMLTKETFLTNARSSNSSGNSEVVQRAIEFINNHFSENILLDEMAEHVHLSSIYFHNMFKAAVGQTPHRYLLSTRLSNAKKMLNISEHSFAEIAAACGFPSQSYFNYVFKREFGITPREYRQEISRSWDEQL